MSGYVLESNFMNKTGKNINADIRSTIIISQ